MTVFWGSSFLFRAFLFPDLCMLASHSECPASGSRGKVSHSYGLIAHSLTALGRSELQWSVLH
eukprot:2869961-Amphidinium_carterae.1